jgi:hypothetical protein
MFEGRREKVAPFPVFLKRMARWATLSAGLVFIVLLIGVAGYHWLGELGWVDSLVEASMILGGMGAVSPLKTTAVKLFASAYALFSGLVFIAAMGLLLTPVVHRMLHKFHVE